MVLSSYTLSSRTGKGSNNGADILWTFGFRIYNAQYDWPGQEAGTRCDLFCDTKMYVRLWCKLNMSHIKGNYFHCILYHTFQFCYWQVFTVKECEAFEFLFTKLILVIDCLVSVQLT